MKTFNITISNLTFEELKETVMKLGDTAIAGAIETVSEAPKVSAASVMTASTPGVVEAKATPAKRAPKKPAHEPVAPLFVPEENVAVPPQYAPSQPISTAQPTVQVVHSAPPVQHTHVAFDRAGTIANIQGTVDALKAKLVDIDAVRAVINDTYASLGMNPEPMTGLPDDAMAHVYKAFFNKAQGILNGNLAGSLV